jgi:hypothetical protein
VLKRIGLVAIGALMFAQPVLAQEDHWGATFAVTPSWETGVGVKHLFAADRIDMRGSDMRFGFVRGWDTDGDWGISFVRTTIANNSSLDVDVTPCSRGNCGTFLRTTQPTRMTGFEAHKFEPFKTWRNRVQIGGLGAVGAAWMRGKVYKLTTAEDGDVESWDANASDMFPPTHNLVPLVRVELAGAAIVAPGLKVRASGGFSMPGYHVFNLTFVYIPHR